MIRPMPLEPPVMSTTREFSTASTYRNARMVVDIMASIRSHHDATPITSVRPGRTLDVEARTQRYLITMGIRTVCFLAFLVVPGWWKIAMLALAVVLPLIAVLLANQSDHRPPPDATAGAGSDVPALLPGQTIEGTVEDED